MSRRPAPIPGDRPLHARAVRTLAVSAGSGLVRREGEFLVVADDEHALFVFGRAGAGRRITLLPGDLPADHDARKARKPDFEVLVDLGDAGLLALGSGSRPTRERAVHVDGRERTTVIDTAPLCAVLRVHFPELNLEGGVLRGDELVLLQRGNRGDRRNALVFVAGDDLRAALASRRFAPESPLRVVALDFGDDGGVPWTGTDLALLADGDLLASVVLEDTADAYADGACLGSALVRLGADGTVRWQWRLDAAAKVEGVAVDGDTAWLVSDADDRAVPSRLLRVSFADPS